MNIETKSNSDGDRIPDLHALTNEVASLKREMASLLRSMKVDVSGEVASARHAAEHLGHEAQHAYENLAARGKRSVKAIGHEIEEQPVMSLLLAFAVGFIGSRMLSR
jgi:ElaB/YqjD/DUF883 family membrane-anchored ribosome-binding protein